MSTPVVSRPTRFAPDDTTPPDNSLGALMDNVTVEPLFMDEYGYDRPIIGSGTVETWFNRFKQDYNVHWVSHGSSHLDIVNRLAVHIYRFEFTKIGDPNCVRKGTVLDVLFHTDDDHWLLLAKGWVHGDGSVHG